MNQTDRKELEELVPEKFSLGKSIGKCDLCQEDIYEHDLILSMEGRGVAHSLCLYFNLKGGELECE